MFIDKPRVRIIETGEVGNVEAISDDGFVWVNIDGSVGTLKYEEWEVERIPVK